MVSITCPGLDIQERYSRQAGPFELSGDSDRIKISIDTSTVSESNIENNTTEGTLRNMSAFSTLPVRTQGFTIAWEYLGAVIFAVIIGGVVIVLLKK